MTISQTIIIKHHEIEFSYNQFFCDYFMHKLRCSNKNLKKQVAGSAIPMTDCVDKPRDSVDKQQDDD